MRASLRRNLVVVFAVAAMLSATAGSATVTTSVGNLTGAAENPPNASSGTGVATVTYDSVAHSMTVTVSFSGLVGTTTAAHIHCCVDAPGVVGVATPTPSFPGFPAGGFSGTYQQTFDLTQAASYNPAFVTAQGSVAAAEAALAGGLASGRAYFNLHTSVFGGGEIRAFLVPLRSLVEVPALAPWGLGVLILLLAAAGVVRSRRRARG